MKKKHKIFLQCPETEPKTIISQITSKKLNGIIFKATPKANFVKLKFYGEITEEEVFNKLKKFLKDLQFGNFLPLNESPIASKLKD